MVAYFTMGLFWSLIMGLANESLGLQYGYNHIARILAIFLWPVFVMVFLYQFAKESIDRFFILFLVGLFTLLATSCSKEELDRDLFVLGSPSVVNSLTQSGDIFTFYPVDESYIQDVYVDTLQNAPYFKLFTEASAMKAEYLYNGEHNVWGEYLSNQPYIETGKQFRLSTQATDYDLPQGKIYGRNIIGVRNNQAVAERQVVEIYVEVYFDGYHREYDTLKIRLNPAE